MPRKRMKSLRAQLEQLTESNKKAKTLASILRDDVLEAVNGKRLTSNEAHEAIAILACWTILRLHRQNRDKEPALALAEYYEGTFDDVRAMMEML